MYTKFFGFTDKPFNVTPDPRFLYLTPSHQEALASMIYGIRERKGFVSIIGEVGTGKTTLLHTLFNELDKEIKTVFIFNTRINFNQLLQNILIELELTPKSTNKSELLNQLNDFLIEKLSLGENVALIIDEAQHLPSPVLEELRMLSNLETDREKLIQIILVGQPELDTKLRSPELRQLKQRVGINCYLTPLNREERIEYILHRLNVAGCKSNHIFSQKATELICKHSRGIPRIINILCDNALVSAYGKERKRIDTDIVGEVISDYERSKLPINEKSKVTTTSLEERKRLFTKSRLALVFVCALIAFPTLGISIHGDTLNSFDQFLNAVSTAISTTWQKIERSTRDPIEKNSPQKSQEPSTHTTRGRSIHDLSLNLQKKAANDDQPTIENLPPFEQIPPSSEGDSMPTDSLCVGKNNKVVFAKMGDMVSSLALREYKILNDTIFDIVKRANPEIKDLDRISIGQKIIIPSLDIESTIVEIAKGVFSIHIASFSSYDDAKQYLNKLRGEKYQSSIFPVMIAGKRPWYRITMGNFTSRTKAIECAKSTKLDELPINKFLVRD